MLSQIMVILVHDNLGTVLKLQWVIDVVPFQSWSTPHSRQNKCKSSCGQTVSMTVLVEFLKRPLDIMLTMLIRDKYM